MTIQFIRITPSGTYYATCSDSTDDARAFLLQLLHAETSYPYSPELVTELTGESPPVAERLFRSLLERGLIELSAKPAMLATESIERALPDLLPRLSSNARAILADDQGFCLGNSGYPEDQAERLAALTADLLSLQERHQTLLRDELHLLGESWGVVDPLGQSQIGFWVLHVGTRRFVLALSGIPRLNDPAFVYLVAALTRRYLEI